MLPFQRHAAPAFLLKNWERWGLKFQARRRENPGAIFSWPSKDGQAINRVLEPLLAAQTLGRCAYCDDWPLGSREDSIDHCRPKSDERFHHLVCLWENLYYACGNCQGFKREQWSDDPLLILADEEGYAFEKFFIVDIRSGNIDPNPAATEQDQNRAEYTITTLGLRDIKHLIGRRRTWDHYCKTIACGDPVDIDDFAYRYLF